MSPVTGQHLVGRVGEGYENTLDRRDLPRGQSLGGRRTCVRRVWSSKWSAAGRIASVQSLGSLCWFAGSQEGTTAGIGNAVVGFWDSGSGNQWRC